ncbi:hypothetical protein NDU88_003775 [Pleurodeles waltl]|uniref:Uncharacterized protein n=1 Tax=Pleurodeles waltl TaxID=8319 RepID=A0AAV7MTF9_PLEWA|nr:hypothetical protein NDU88_003775 [Pleurodeles waltl]
MRQVELRRSRLDGIPLWTTDRSSARAQFQESGDSAPQQNERRKAMLGLTVRGYGECTTARRTRLDSSANALTEIKYAANKLTCNHVFSVFGESDPIPPKPP